MKFYVKYNIMIFNKQNKGTEELRELTGNYYKNNDFSKVSAQIELVTEEVTAIIGQKIYKKAEKAYTENSEDKDIQKLIRKIHTRLQLWQHYECINVMT